MDMPFAVPRRREHAMTAAFEFVYHQNIPALTTDLVK
jgi:hypothetical protein